MPANGTANLIPGAAAKRFSQCTLDGVVVQVYKSLFLQTHSSLDNASYCVLFIDFLLLNEGWQAGCDSYLK